MYVRIISLVSWLSVIVLIWLNILDIISWDSGTTWGMIVFVLFGIISSSYIVANPTPPKTTTIVNNAAYPVSEDNLFTSQ